MNELKIIENELVPVYETDKGIKVVNGRELHQVLQSGQDFSTWVKKRLTECDATENEDFELFHNSVEQVSGAKHRIDYIIKLDTAKEMAMMERNEKGKQVRRYFIQVEKKYKNEVHNKLPNGKELLAMAVIEAQKTIEQQNEQIEIMKPKALFADAVATSKASILIGELAKILKQNGIETGEKRLFKWLRNNGYLIKRQGTDYNMPTQRSMELSLFEVKETVITHGDGHTTVNKTTKVTGKGQQYFINRFLTE